MKFEQWQTTGRGLRNEFDDDGETDYGVGADNLGGPDESGHDDGQDDGESLDNPQGSGSGGFDYDAFAAAQARALQPLINQRQVSQPQKELTDEEFGKLTKRYTPNAQLVDAMFGENATPESRLEALSQMINGVAQHTLTSSGLLLKAELDGVRQQLTPLQEYRQQQTQRDFEGGLVKSYPDLKPYMKLVPGVVAQLKAAGATASTTKEAHALVAKAVEQHVKGFIPAFKLANGQQQNGGGVNTTGRRMPSMAAMGGGGGGGRRSTDGSSTTTKTKAVNSVFGD